MVLVMENTPSPQQAQNVGVDLDEVIKELTDQIGRLSADRAMLRSALKSVQKQLGETTVALRESQDRCSDLELRLGDEPQTDEG